mmetsp:Transcript_28409/g.73644  ORF Transcript_28409/g.73644 Transcript_28409/m.73644 type:complete len:229 (-) Transcript_28409:688-1374(-)
MSATAPISSDIAAPSSTCSTSLVAGSLAISRLGCCCFSPSTLVDVSLGAGLTSSDMAQSAPSSAVSIACSPTISGLVCSPVSSATSSSSELVGLPTWRRPFIADGGASAIATEVLCIRLSSSVEAIKLAYSSPARASASGRGATESCRRCLAGVAVAAVATAATTAADALLASSTATARSARCSATVCGVPTPPPRCGVSPPTVTAGSRRRGVHAAAAAVLQPQEQDS